MLTIETLNPYQFNFSLHRTWAEPYSSIFARLHKSLLSLNGLKQHNFSSHHLNFLADEEILQVTSNWKDKILQDYCFQLILYL